MVFIRCESAATIQETLLLESNSATPAPPLRIDSSPVEVANSCRHLPGLVFFDSATEEEGAISIVAALPSEVLSGRDWKVLERAVASRTTARLEEGIVAGFVEYGGLFCFGIYPHVLVYRHEDRTWHGSPALAGDLRPMCEAASVPGPAFRPEATREAFLAGVAAAQEYIAAGDIYQVNLSHRLLGDWAGDPWDFHKRLRRCSPAPYAAFLELCGRAVVSASPELFLKMEGPLISTQPIKGTRPRRADPAADFESSQELLRSQKEAAELVMITDLERSDLGQVCQFGSVQVRELLGLRQFEDVFHLVSTVQGLLRSEVTHVQALRLCFPGGSITGAPKKRAMEIIAELEPIPRGLYTGAIGYFGFNRESQFSVAIRTVICEAGHAHFHVGAGIVADSIPEAEYQETWDKAAGILRAARG
jgi:para-aminobenzoate synthetase component 1